MYFSPNHFAGITVVGRNSITSFSGILRLRGRGNDYSFMATQSIQVNNYINNNNTTQKVTQVMIWEQLRVQQIISTGQIKIGNHNFPALAEIDTL